MPLKFLFSFLYVSIISYLKLTFLNLCHFINHTDIKNKPEENNSLKNNFIPDIKLADYLYLTSSYFQ